MINDIDEVWICSMEILYNVIRNENFQHVLLLEDHDPK